MARTFNSISSFVAHMNAVIATLPEAQHRALEKAAALVERDARGLIGTYDAGWEPLAETTLNGFKGFPGKIELGYAPPDNPLLRDGTFRDGIEHKVIDHNHAAIGSDDRRAEWFELGTANMPARPVMGAAGARRAHDVVHIIGTGVNRHLAGLG
jgi:hypothetical protein